LNADKGSQTKEVAGDRLATSAQPPHVTPTLTVTLRSELTPHPVRSLSLLDTPDVLREGLRCSTAPRPLPTSVATASKHLLRPEAHP
jgi:hypothetical protein